MRRTQVSLVFVQTVLTCSSLAADAPAEKPLPAEVDLRPQFEQWNLPPRRQGRRNTCSVFVTVGAFEFALAKVRGEGTPLSVEYLNWACNQHIGNSTTDRGQFFHHLLAGYEKQGLCREDLMPYERRFYHTQPSEEAKADAEALHKLGFTVHWIRPWSKSAGLNDKQFAAIRATLAAGWPVCVGSGHSRLFVGYVDDPADDGGGRFIARDSGIGGYSHASYAWAREHIYDLFWVEAPAGEN